LTLNLLVVIAKRAKLDLHQLTLSPLLQQLSSIVTLYSTSQESLLLLGYLHLHRDSQHVQEARNFHRHRALDSNARLACHNLDS
jgi:hypothetical protein